MVSTLHEMYLYECASSLQTAQSLLLESSADGDSSGACLLILPDPSASRMSPAPMICMSLSTSCAFKVVRRLSWDSVEAEAVGVSTAPSSDRETVARSDGPKSAVCNR